MKKEQEEWEDEISEWLSLTCNNNCYLCVDCVVSLRRIIKKIKQPAKQELWDDITNLSLWQRCDCLKKGSVIIRDERLGEIKKKHNLK